MSRQASTSAAEQARQCSPLRSPAMLAVLGSLLALAAVTGALFSGAAVQVDRGVATWIAAASPAWLHEAALHATVLGNSLVTIATALLVGGILALVGRRYESILMLVSLPIVGAAVWTGKHLVGRPRPEVAALIPFTDSPAYPSGHAAMGAALAAALSIAVCRMLQGRRRVRRWVIGGAIGFAIGIAATRLILGVHYLTDVLSGLALGLCLVAACAQVLDRWQGSARKTVGETSTTPTLQVKES